MEGKVVQTMEAEELRDRIRELVQQLHDEFYGSDADMVDEAMSLDQRRKLAELFLVFGIRE